jgi:hypothetical protein
MGMDFTMHTDSGHALGEVSASANYDVLFWQPLLGESIWSLHGKSGDEVAAALSDVIDQLGRDQETHVERIMSEPYRIQRGIHSRQDALARIERALEIAHQLHAMAAASPAETLCIF